MMLLYSIALLLGFLILFKSADQFVIGSVATARKLNLSPMVIGLTVVALGTSAPEIFVAIASSLEGEPALAVGNAIGSNIANIGLVLGVTALFVPLPFRVDILHQDIPILIFVTFCAGVTIFDLHLGRWDGLLLIAGLVMFLYRLLTEQSQAGPLEVSADLAEIQQIPDLPIQRAVLITIASLAFLLISSEVLVWAATHIALQIGVSELVIGLTVIAIGTSLPELVVCITSATKGQTDLAIGNIVGSNIFNILAVLAVPCLLYPVDLPDVVLWRDFAVMFLLTAMLVMFAYGLTGQSRIGRAEGVLLLVIWSSYLCYLYYGEVG
jgi:cation:H+ antiporter